ncbi:MAG: hypothetical protein HQ539_00935 [Parcubacteria group bacterium]|nr:hypothetical protein [Parcubacteria group bacterium]
MPKTEYFFQRKKRSFAQRFFTKGLNTSSSILFSLHESGEDFLESLPSSYPGFALMKVMFGVGSKKSKFEKEIVRTNVSRLIKQGLVAKNPKKQKTYFLTDKGKEIVLYIRDRYSILKEPWDGKLRIVVFDIPEKRRYWRIVIRQELLLFQYEQIQKSVYIGKFPIAKLFCEEIEKAGLGKNIFIFTVDEADRKEYILKLLG